MDWTDNLNDAITYIEQNLTEKLDYSAVAAAACCSLSKFQRLFLFVTGITVSEYIKRRRMTLAAQELITGGVKVLDLAYKYGYESPESFTRAYLSFHGFPPSATKRRGVYCRYDRIFVETNIIGGDTMNAKHNEQVRANAPEPAKGFIKNHNEVTIQVNPEITADQLWHFYTRNNTYEVAYGDKDATVRPLKNTPLYIGAFYEQKLVGILRVLHDGLTALIVEFGLELELQGVPENECGFLLKGDQYGIGKRMGELMMKELTAKGIDFISFDVVEGVEEDFYSSLGFFHNPGHKQYIWDNRPFINEK